MISATLISPHFLGDLLNEVSLSGVSIGGLDLLPIIAGVAVASVIAIIAQNMVGDGEGARYRKRMATAKRDRAAMKDAILEKDQARQRNEKALEATLSKLRLEKQITKRTFRERLARAGIREKRHMVMFVLAQVALPPIMMALAVIAFHLWLKWPGAGYDIYACVAVGGAIIGYLLPGMRIDGMSATRFQEIEQALPDALDLLTICVESGMSVEQGLSRVSKELGPHASTLAEEIELLTAELAYLGDRRAAFENFVNRTGAPSVKTIVSALVQAEKYGTPIGQALRVIAGESRFTRMANAETKAAALPAKLTVPMMVFFVPALFVVILGPAILQIMEQFSS